jgi:hypothetical protein
MKTYRYRSYREQAILAIVDPPRCQECGWDRGLDGLCLSTRDGSAYKTIVTKGADRYYREVCEEITTNPLTHSYRVLCWGCMKLLMSQRLENKRASVQKVNLLTPTPEVVVWKSTLGKADTFSHHNWLHQHIGEGRKVFVLWEGEVMEYPNGESFKDWEGFAMAYKIGKDAPRDGVVVYGG